MAPRNRIAHQTNDETEPKNPRTQDNAGKTYRIPKTDRPKAPPTISPLDQGKAKAILARTSTKFRHLQQQAKIEVTPLAKLFREEERAERKQELERRRQEAKKTEMQRREKIQAQRQKEAAQRKEYKEQIEARSKETEKAMDWFTSLVLESNKEIMFSPTLTFGQTPSHQSTEAASPQLKGSTPLTTTQAQILPSWSLVEISLDEQDQTTKELRAVQMKEIEIMNEIRQIEKDLAEMEKQAPQDNTAKLEEQQPTENIHSPTFDRILKDLQPNKEKETQQTNKHKQIPRQGMQRSKAKTFQERCWKCKRRGHKSSRCTYQRTST